MTPIAPSSHPPLGWVSVWEPMSRAGPGWRERPRTVPIPSMRASSPASSMRERSQWRDSMSMGVSDCRTTPMPQAPNSRRRRRSPSRRSGSIATLTGLDGRLIPAPAIRSPGSHCAAAGRHLVKRGPLRDGGGAEAPVSGVKETCGAAALRRAGAARPPEGGDRRDPGRAPGRALAGRRGPPPHPRLHRRGGRCGGAPHRGGAVPRRGALARGRAPRPRALPAPGLAPGALDRRVPPPRSSHPSPPPSGASSPARATRPSGASSPPTSPSPGSAVLRPLRRFRTTSAHARSSALRPPRSLRFGCSPACCGPPAPGTRSRPTFPIWSASLRTPADPPAITIPPLTRGSADLRTRKLGAAAIIRRADWIGRVWSSRFRAPRPAVRGMQAEHRRRRPARGAGHGKVPRESTVPPAEAVGPEADRRALAWPAPAPPQASPVPCRTGSSGRRTAPT